MATGRVRKNFCRTNFACGLFDGPASQPKSIQACSFDELMEQKRILLAKLNAPIARHNALAAPAGGPFRPAITEKDAEHPKSFCEKYLSFNVNPEWEPRAQHNWGGLFVVSYMAAMAFTVVSRNPNYLPIAVKIIGNTLTWASTAITLYFNQSFNGYEQATQLEALHAVCKELEARGVERVVGFKFKK